jgi:hypothetical protein
MLVTSYQITRCHTAEDSNIHILCVRKVKSNTELGLIACSWKICLKKEFVSYTLCGPCRSLDGKSLVSHRGGRGSSPGLVMWDLWWTKWRWRRFSPSTLVSTANLYSTNCSTITIIYHLGLIQEASSGRSTKWTQSHTTKNNIRRIRELEFLVL